MIIPMKKYSFLIHHHDFNAFLEDLQHFGVLDIVDSGVEPDEETSGHILKSEQYKRSIRFLKPKISDDKSGQSIPDPDTILHTIQQYQAEHESAKQKMAALDKAYRILRPWGDFSRELIEKLAAKGFHVKFFAVSDKKFQSNWLEEYNLEVISHTEGHTFFVIVQRDGEDLVIDADEVKAPERPATEVIREKESLESRIKEIDRYYGDYAVTLVPVLEEEKRKLDAQISFNNVVKGAGREADNRLMIIEGWVPEPKLEEVNSFLDEKGVFFIVDDPTPKEKVPILLKNGKFSKLFEPIGKLYSLPDYKEFDLTPFFAPFFMLFFGFCLGDAGYGILFLIVATLLKPKMKAEAKPILTLLQWLGGSTIIFGAIGGTFFGMNLIEMVDNGKLTWLAEARTHMLDSQKMFYFALLLGAIQIIFGMIIKASNRARQFGFKYALSTIGWIALILGSGAYYFMSKQLDAEYIKTIFYVWMGLCGVLILFMNNPEKNIFVNFGGGLWEVYSIVTGVMGDLLSYIRLFALGVSSAILGYVFNDLAMQMSGSTPVVSQLVFLIILLIGHGLNIFMATLGAFVHPMRLTFVEFYKNAGFAGGGKAYSPFSKK